ncbi:anti-sigma factor domain-containing protein [Clostridium thailandense]|uniref:anti-sigma factor domain-containing protein n=1 Tax=Clostridium thailandense TaxID=2794346 RepID=UPI0039891748
MISKNGLVMKVKKDFAYIMTPNGEFVKVKIDKSKAIPTIGSEYTGKVLNTSTGIISKFRYVIAASLLFFLLILGGGAYAYYTPVSTVTININPSIEFKLNRWSRIVTSHALNSDGQKILSELSTKNKPIDETLVMVINQAKTDKYINQSYVAANKAIIIDIVGKDVNLPNLKEQLAKDTVNAKIHSNGNTVFIKETKKTSEALHENHLDQNSKSNINVDSNANKSNINNNSNNSSNSHKYDKTNDNNSKNSNSNNSHNTHNVNSENNDKKDNYDDKHENSDNKSNKDKNDNNHNNSKSDKNKGK